MKNQQGFTLIEAIVYLVLFTIIMVGVISASFTMFELSDRTQTKSMLNAEGDFLLGKINWVFSGISVINVPTSGSSGSGLSVNKWDSSFGNPLVMDLDNSSPESVKLRLKKGLATAVALNNDNTSITSLNFNHQGTGSEPEFISATFSISAKTPQGSSVSQTFFTTRYLKK